MVIKTERLIYYILVLILTLNFSCFYLLDNDTFHLDDVAFILELLVLFMYVVSHAGRFEYRKGIIALLMCLPIILAITSSLAAGASYNQPFLLGFRAQRHWIMALLMYFPLQGIVDEGIVTVRELKKLIYVFGIIYLIIATIQGFVANSVVFVHVSHNTGYGNMKFYFDESILVLLYVLALQEVFNENTFKERVLNIALCAWIIYFLFYITRYRTVLVALLVSSILAIMLFAKIDFKKVLIVCIGCVAFWGILQTEWGQTIQDAYYGNDSSFEMRTVGRTFYLSKLQGNYLFGCGFIHVSWPEAYSAGGVSQRIYYNDNGFFGILFYYGLIGVAWLAALNVKIFTSAFRWLREEKIMWPFIFAAVNVIVLATGLPNYMDATLITPLFLVLIEADKEEDAQLCGNGYEF